MKVLKLIARQGTGRTDKAATLGSIKTTHKNH